MVMPSNTASAWSLSSTRSLKVPGSPSSALQTTQRCGPLASLSASRQTCHLRAVGKPAPPRPRSPARASSSIRAWGSRAITAGKAGACAGSPLSSTSARCTVLSTWNQSAGQSSTGTSDSMSAASASTRAASSRVMTWWWLISSAGPWSHRPVHDARSTLNRPWASVSPGDTPRHSQSRASSASLPNMRSVMLSENSTRSRPTGRMWKKR
ncbi:hypothetical protein D9M69_460770 [compost metagenome]